MKINVGIIDNKIKICNINSFSLNLFGDKFTK